MLVRWLRRRRLRRIRRSPKSAPTQVYENPYRHGVCAADWTKK